MKSGNKKRNTVRKSSYTETEVAELDAFNKNQTHSAGVKLGSVRDRGHAVMRNGVQVYWSHPKYEHEPIKIDGVEYMTSSSSQVASGDFGMVIDGKMVVFNAEELRRYLRWA